MIQLDVLSSFAICGAGALVGAAMLRPNLSDDVSIRESLRLFRNAFALVGVGLLQPAVIEMPLPLWSEAAMVYASFGGLIMIGWALSALSGGRRSRSAMWFTLGAVLAVVLAGLPAGVKGMNFIAAAGLVVGSAVSAWLGRRLCWHPRDMHERLLGVTILLMLLSSALRASYLLTWNGPFEPNLLYVPPAMVTPFALLYGVLPILFAMLLHNVVNARLQARLHQRAMTDYLTGCLSRQALAEGVPTLTAQARQRSGGLSLIMVDFDHFKQINDRHGHAAGDAVLRHAVTVMQRQLRGEALLARYGGEEFVVMQPVSDLPAARRVAERMRRSVEQANWSDVVPGLAGVTASLGVTLFALDEGLEQALARADEALYRAKASGRNQVQAALVAA